MATHSYSTYWSRTERRQAIASPVIFRCSSSTMTSSLSLQISRSAANRSATWGGAGSVGVGGAEVNTKPSTLRQNKTVATQSVERFSGTILKRLDTGYKSLAITYSTQLLVAGTTPLLHHSCHVWHLHQLTKRVAEMRTKTIDTRPLRTHHSHALARENITSTTQTRYRCL